VVDRVRDGGADTDHADLAETLGAERIDDVIALVDEFFPWATIPIVIYTADIGPELRRRRDHVYVLAKSSDPMPLLSLMQRAIWAAKQAEAARDEEPDLGSSRGRT